MKPEMQQNGKHMQPFVEKMPSQLVAEIYANEYNTCIKMSFS